MTSARTTGRIAEASPVLGQPPLDESKADPSLMDLTPKYAETCLQIQTLLNSLNTITSLIPDVNGVIAAFAELPRKTRNPHPSINHMLAVHLMLVTCSGSLGGS